MYCEKCGRPLRIGTEQVGIDERNLPVIHRFGYCDNCRIKWDLDLPVAPPAPPQMRCPRCGGTNIQFNLAIKNRSHRWQSARAETITTGAMIRNSQKYCITPL